MNGLEPPRLIQHILLNEWPEAYARAVDHPEEIGFRSEGGFTSLHYAIGDRLTADGERAPSDFIRLLVEDSPHGPAITEYRTDQGLIALHLACMLPDPDYVRILLTASGRTATIADNNGMDPLDWAVASLSLSSKKVPPYSEMSDEEISDYRSRAWRVIQMLVWHRVQREALSPMSSLRPGLNFLHACAGIAKCRPHMLPMLFSPQEIKAMAKARDDAGQLPLHVAATNTNLSGKRAAVFLAYLLTVFPAAAREVDQRSGQLPLHAAIASGKRWDEGLKAIVDAFPLAITVRDPVTRQFPFMMAADAVNGAFGRTRLFSSKTENVDTAYELVRLCPELDFL